MHDKVFQVLVTMTRLGWVRLGQVIVMMMMVMMMMTMMTTMMMTMMTMMMTVWSGWFGSS